MSAVISALHRWAHRFPVKPAIRSETRQISWLALKERVDALSAFITETGAKRVALQVENGLSWIVSDLAALDAGVVGIPIPTFFSGQQVVHVLTTTHTDLFITDRELPTAIPHAHGLTLKNLEDLQIWKLIQIGAEIRIPQGTSKITFTSGTTGTPKGVCLTQSSLEAVATSLLAVTGATAEDHHLNVLPLSLLLENVAGLYAPILAGATIQVRSPDTLGFKGSSQIRVQRLAATIGQSRASTLVLVPQLLEALVGYLELQPRRFPHLRFVAVGGAPLSEPLLKRARMSGLPVFEGYGLSEGASVVTLNRPGADLRGSVGKPLPHTELWFSAEGEILIRGPIFTGYLGQPETDSSQWWATGDLGHQDEAGFLFLTGRKSTRFITAYGRNVSPEWVENALTQCPMIRQVCVFGEAKPWNVALVVSQNSNESTQDTIQRALDDSINPSLPDYARVRRWAFVEEPFSIDNGLMNPLGKLRRDQIASQYAQVLEELHANP